MRSCVCPDTCANIAALWTPRVLPCKQAIHHPARSDKTKRDTPRTAFYQYQNTDKQILKERYIMYLRLVNQPGGEGFLTHTNCRKYEAVYFLPVQSNEIGSNGEGGERERSKEKAEHHESLIAF